MPEAHATAPADTALAAQPTAPDPHRGWHLRPFAGAYRMALLSRFMPELWLSVVRWVETAQPIPDCYHAAHGPAYNRADLAHVLNALSEWDGYHVCEKLRLYGWQCNAELVGIIHTWSCQVHTTLRAEAKPKGRTG